MNVHSPKMVLQHHQERISRAEVAGCMGLGKAMSKLLIVNKTTISVSSVALKLQKWIMESPL